MKRLIVRPLIAAIWFTTCWGFVDWVLRDYSWHHQHDLFEAFLAAWGGAMMVTSMMPVNTSGDSHPSTTGMVQS